MNKIIGDKGKSKYDPSLADKVNKEVDEGKFVDEPKIIVPTNVDIEDICNGYEEFMKLPDIENIIPTNITNKYNPTKEQIRKFSKKLIDYKAFPNFYSNTSNYLTALMHSSKNNKFEIEFNKLNERGIGLSDIGSKLKDLS